ncbi:MAG: hypothetical protein AAB792_02750 [Patescibacteria group bacterium]
MRFRESVPSKKDKPMDPREELLKKFPSGGREDTEGSEQKLLAELEAEFNEKWNEKNFPGALRAFLRRFSLVSTAREYEGKRTLEYGDVNLRGSASPEAPVSTELADKIVRYKTLDEIVREMSKLSQLLEEANQYLKTLVGEAPDMQNKRNDITIATREMENLLKTYAKAKERRMQSL